MAYSQLSQRYVDEADCAFVMPPAVQDSSFDDQMKWRWDVLAAQEAYIRAVARLEEQYRHVENRTQRRKLAREAARSLLPNATETKIVATGNVRAWRHILAMRTGSGAEREIRAMAITALKLLQLEAPEFFGDFVIEPDGLGGLMAHPQYLKV
jgi:thymidylate synthase (FAD)